MSDFNISVNDTIQYNYMTPLYLVNFTSTFIMVIPSAHPESGTAQTLNLSLHNHNLITISPSFT